MQANPFYDFENVIDSDDEMDKSALDTNEEQASHWRWDREYSWKGENLVMEVFYSFFYDWFYKKKKEPNVNQFWLKLTHLDNYYLIMDLILQDTEEMLGMEVKFN